MMRINTDHSIRLGEQLHSEFGSWEAIRRAARVENGTYVVSSDAHPDTEPKREKPEAA